MPVVTQNRNKYLAWLKITMLDEKEYNYLYSHINSRRDISKLAKQGYPTDLLEEILVLKLTRNTKGMFYRINRKRLLGMWKSGLSITKLARRYGFSPVMLGYILLQEMGYSKKKASKIVNGKEEIDGELREKLGERLARELKRAWKEDVAYSPYWMERQVEKGVNGEERIKEWLEKRGLDFRREEELRGEYRKTPDFLLAKPIAISGKKVKWIESKASIGDLDKAKRDYKKQLRYYLEEFGPGAIVYWIGLLPSARSFLEDKGVLVLEDLPGD